ncbi:MAG: DNA repair exonuclease [Dehalococcoidia bacterium]
MRFLHTADWQIGMKASHVGEAGAHVREQRLKTARHVMALAKERQVDFIVVAGDTFENNGVDRVLVQKVADILASANMAVFVIPGNHDPLVPGSVWEHPAWKSIANVQVLFEAKSVEIPGGLLFPSPVREKHSGKDPTAWISAADNEGIRIGVAHGTVEGVQQEEPDYPIPRDAAIRTGLDYLALGHWHSMATYPAPDATVRMAYSGTHETTKFGERDSGNILIVEIVGKGDSPRVEAVRTGGLEWLTIEATIGQAGDLAALHTQIDTIGSPSSALLDLQIEGLIKAEDEAELRHISEIVASRFLYGRLDVSRVFPSPEDDTWIASLPAGIIREAGSRLQQLAAPNFVGTRPEGATPEVASRALMELFAILREAQE